MNKIYHFHEVSEISIGKWQKTLNVIAELFEVPAALIMRVHPRQIEVLVSSHSEKNPYKPGEKANLGSGLYCETVMATNSQLVVPNSLMDEKWKNNPDVEINMISYFGIPLVWNNDEIFGTLCVLDNKTRNYSHLYQSLLWELKAIIENDFSQYTKMEEDLSILSTVLQQSPNSVVITDLMGNIEYVNPKFCNQTGYTSEEILSKSTSILKGGETPGETYKQLWENILSGKNWSGELHNRKKNGDLYWENVLIFPIFNKDKQIIHFAAMKEDVTELKLKEEQNARMQEQLNHRNTMNAIGQLAGGIAHDFNNILSGIISTSQLLKSPQRNPDPKSIKYIDMILQASLRAADLTSKLLNYSRKGKMSSDLMNLHEVVDNTTEILSNTIDKRISVVVRKDADSYFINGDISALHNALMNLSINASHSMEDGGAIQIITKNVYLNKISCDASSFDIEPGLFCKIEVNDTGCGISSDLLNKIFEPFFTTKEQGKGSGLGLSSVYGTVQDHNGMIEVYSEIGKGSSFQILLPCTEDSGKVQHLDEEVHTGLGVILLVDDEEIIRMAGQDTLEDLGYKILLAEDGYEAVEIFKKHHSEIDLIILDMQMPKMNGYEAFFKIKEIDKECKIVLSSGFMDNMKLDSLKKSGLDGFISKPYKDSELCQLLTEILGS